MHGASGFPKQGGTRRESVTNELWEDPLIQCLGSVPIKIGLVILLLYT